ncbi:Z-ring formation inhibitor MciZ [Paenibacillus tarimensis]
MKRDMNETQLRMTGKAWEIRHMLRKLAGSGNGQRTLSDYLKKAASTHR